MIMPRCRGRRSRDANRRGFLCLSESAVRSSLASFKIASRSFQLTAATSASWSMAREPAASADVARAPC